MYIVPPGGAIPDGTQNGDFSQSELFRLQAEYETRKATILHRIELLRKSKTSPMHRSQDIFGIEQDEQRLLDELHRLNSEFAARRNSLQYRL